MQRIIFPLPGIAPAAKDRVFSVAPRTPARTCVAAPCKNQIATDAVSKPRS